MTDKTKCNNCGAELAPNDEKCLYCGTPNPNWTKPIPAITPSNTSTALDESSSIHPRARYIAGYLSLIAVIVIIIVYLFLARQTSNKEAAAIERTKNAMEEQRVKNNRASYEPLRHWRYFNDMNDDSVMTYHESDLYSDQSLIRIESFAAKSNFPPYDDLYHMLSSDYRLYEVLQIREDFGTHPEFGIKLQLPAHTFLPFKKKPLRYIILRFDSDPSMTLPLPDYDENLDDMVYLPEPRVMLARLKHSHSLSVFLGDHFSVTDTLKLTFQTDNLKW